MASEYHHPQEDYFRKVLDATPPTAVPHLTEEEIAEKLKPLKTWGWKLSGDQLECMTDQGRLVQKIPPGYICHGTDAAGMPILRKISLEPHSQTQTYF